MKVFTERKCFLVGWIRVVSSTEIVRGHSFKGSITKSSSRWLGKEILKLVVIRSPGTGKKKQGKVVMKRPPSHGGGGTQFKLRR